MKLKLTKPLIVFDIESTGLDREKDRIVELAVIKIYPDGVRRKKCQRFNPEMPISASASATHGIKDEDVKDCPTFRQMAKSILEFFEDADLCGFGSNHFDIPMLYNEFLRCDITFNYQSRRFIDAGNIFKIQEPRTLGAAYQFYCNKTLENAHTAEADAEATLEVLEAQFERYEALPVNLDELHLFCNHGKSILDLSGKFTLNEGGQIVFTFGPHRNFTAKDYPDFLNWMVYKANFNPDTVQIANKLIEGVI